MIPSELKHQIVCNAVKYVGEKEVKNNMGFVNKDFEKKMIQVGFKNSYAWCCLFCKLIWFESDCKFWKLISPSVIKTMRNFNDMGYNLKADALPGSIAIFRNYKNNKPLGTGHAGIVIDSDDKVFNLVEGNSNNNGSREGDTVVYKTRSYNWKNQNGLRLMGFIHCD